MATQPAWRDSHQDREKAADAARRQMLSRFAERPRLDDPAIVERLAMQKAAGELRAARKAQRDADKQAAAQAFAAEQARLSAERKANEEAEALAIVTRAREEKAAAIALVGQQKAARDARYAARKMRQR